jgi:PAS domain S-box-containing protein
MELKFNLTTTDDIGFNLHELAGGLYLIQDGRFQFINKSAAGFGEYSPSELIGKEAIDLVYSEDRERLTDIKRKQKENISVQCEYRIVTKSGRIRWILETVTKMIYRNRPVWLCNSMDITDHKCMEDALRESEKTAFVLLNATTAAAVLIDPAGSILALNETAATRLGGRSPTLCEGVCSIFFPRNRRRA